MSEIIFIFKQHDFLFFKPTLCNNATNIPPAAKNHATQKLVGQTLSSGANKTIRGQSV